MGNKETEMRNLYLLRKQCSVLILYILGQDCLGSNPVSVLASCVAVSKLLQPSRRTHFLRFYED